MQFDAVVETYHAAVELYKRLGFTVVGTAPAPSPIRPWAAERASLPARTRGVMANVV